MMIFHINNVRSHPTKTLAGPYLWWSSWGETLIDLDAQRIRFLSHWSFIMLLTLIWELHLYLEFEFYCRPVCTKIFKIWINDSSWGYLTYLTSWSFLTSFKCFIGSYFYYFLFLQRLHSQGSKFNLFDEYSLIPQLLQFIGRTWMFCAWLESMWYVNWNDVQGSVQCSLMLCC